jgi:hypothetical protein
LAGAADDDAAVRGSEDFLLLRVGFEFEGFEGEFFGGGGDFERGFGEWGRAGTMSSAEAPRSDSGEQAVSGLARSKYVTPGRWIAWRLRAGSSFLHFFVETGLDFPE